MRKSVALSLLLSLSPLGAVCTAQIELPQPSPAASFKTVVGMTEVAIEYHRPGVKGRKIWGGLVADGEVWRLGANQATTIAFSTPVRVEGNEVPAGTYALFTIPGPDAWTLILNKNPKQWGAFRYKPEEDLVRFPVKPRSGPFTEWLLFTVTPTGRGRGVVEMSWENLRVPFTVETDVDQRVWAQVDTVLAGSPGWQDYLQAATYAEASGQRLDEAMAWIDKSLALEESVPGHEIKAKLLQRKGRIKEAIEQVDLALAQAQDKFPRDVLWKLEQLKAGLLAARDHPAGR